jgi:hypothetical protein
LAFNKHNAPLRITRYHDHNAWRTFFTEDTAGDCGNPSACELFEVDGSSSCTDTPLDTNIARIVDPSVSPFHVEASADLSVDEAVH